MDLKTDLSSAKIDKIEGGMSVIFIELKRGDSQLTKLINSKLLEICAGNRNRDISILKKKIQLHFKNKKKTKERIGSVSEFFTHLYLGNFGFKQEFLFTNLEEKSEKKGFDGYYNCNGIERIMESKSSLSSTGNTTFPNKINEAINDLHDKITNLENNNPRENAYNHACHRDVGCSEEIIDNISILSDDFFIRKPHKLNEFNIIPSTSILLVSEDNNLKNNEVSAKVSKKITEYDLKKDKIIVLCISNESLDIFFDCINE